MAWVTTHGTRAARPAAAAGCTRPAQRAQRGNTMSVRARTSHTLLQSYRIGTSTCLSSDARRACARVCVPRAKDPPPRPRRGSVRLVFQCWCGSFGAVLRVVAIWQFASGEAYAAMAAAAGTASPPAFSSSTCSSAAVGMSGIFSTRGTIAMAFRKVSLSLSAAAALLYLHAASSTTGFEAATIAVTCGEVTKAFHADETVASACACTSRATSTPLARADAMASRSPSSCGETLSA
mmetsp:Transcript_3444/g.13922  ORF Transcript_3444/g.13922 Transcript_3444/m.13922 type:complete len:236 (+) Transcript_3444:524-1231(+)